MSECNSIESADLTYYQRNRDVILNRAEDYYENDKKSKGSSVVANNEIKQSLQLAEELHKPFIRNF